MLASKNTKVFEASAMEEVTAGELWKLEQVDTLDNGTQILQPKAPTNKLGVKTFCWTTSTSNFCFYTGQVPRWQCAGWWCCIVCRWRGKLVLWEGPPACTMLWPSSCDCSDPVQAVGSSFALCMLGTCGQCTHDAGAFAKGFHFCHICRRFQKDHNFDPMDVELFTPLQPLQRLSTASLSRLLQPLKALCSLWRLFAAFPGFKNMLFYNKAFMALLAM